MKKVADAECQKGGTEKAKLQLYSILSLSSLLEVGIQNRSKTRRPLALVGKCTSVPRAGKLKRGLGYLLVIAPVTLEAEMKTSYPSCPNSQ